MKTNPHITEPVDIAELRDLLSIAAQNIVAHDTPSIRAQALLRAAGYVVESARIELGSSVDPTPREDLKDAPEW